MQSSHLLLVSFQRCRATLYRVCNAVIHAYPVDTLAPGSMADAMPSFLPIHLGRHPTMLYHVRNAIVHAHSHGTQSRQAHWCAQRHRACPSSRNGVAACPVVCNSASRLPISPQPDRARPSGVGQGDHESKRVAQQPHVADAASRPQDRAHFSNRFRLESHLVQSMRRN